MTQIKKALETNIMCDKDVDQNIVCADLSMRRPGFALLKYSATTKHIEVVHKSNVDNKRAKKSHGQMLSEIAKELRSYLTKESPLVLVREQGFFKFPAETQVLCKVVGITDLYAWASNKAEFFEITPKSVKKSVVGKADATKSDVAEAQKLYVGEQKYACDDESDAVAVGVAWQIQNEYIDQKIEGE